MAGARLRARGRRAISYVFVWLIGSLALGCKCSRTPSSTPVPARMSGQPSAAALPGPPPIEIETAYVTLIRGRQFDEASRMLAGLPAEKAVQPAYQFVSAYLAVHTGNGPKALSALAGLEEKLVELELDIARLRAKAQLQTADALVGAAWLEEHGRRNTWLEAGRNLHRLGKRVEAQKAVDYGLARVKARSKAQETAIIADLRGLRLEVRADAGDAAELAADLIWLATEVPAHLPTRKQVARALDESKILLDPKQQAQRLTRLADAGWVERVDLESARISGATLRMLPSSGREYLRGHVRQVARVEQIEGARLLERAAELKADQASQFRLDAARLYIREGELGEALRLFDSVAARDRARSEEAQFYAARAAALLGEPRRGSERYTQLIERYPRGRWRGIAEQERALAWFAEGDIQRAEPILARLARDAASEDDRPAFLQLAGVAAAQLGQKDRALERLKTALKLAPFGLTGAFAAARLKEMGEMVQSFRLERAPSSQNENSMLSRRTEQLLAFGIEELAAEAYADDRAHASGRSDARAVACGCRDWAKVGFSARGFVFSQAIREAIDLSSPPTDESRWQWDCRFPRPYATMVEQFEAEYHLPQHLLHAVMRQESGFDPDVVSPVGAKGLMQLMPQTASRLAEELGLTGALELGEPRTNLRLGAAYLRKLLDTFSQDLVLAVAGYNAGPQAVALWQGRAGSGSIELFAARIPYTETQKYVERVLSNLRVYRVLNGLGCDIEGLSLTLPKELKDRAGLY